MKPVIDLSKYLSTATLVEYSKSNNIKLALGFCPVYNKLLCRMNSALENYKVETYVAALEEYNARDKPAVFIKPNIWGGLFDFFGNILKWLILGALLVAAAWAVMLFTPLLRSFASGLATVHKARKSFEASKYDARASALKDVSSARTNLLPKIAASDNNKIIDSLADSLGIASNYVVQDLNREVNK